MAICDRNPDASERAAISQSKMRRRLTRLKHTIRRFCERNAPPGMALREEAVWYSILLLIASLYHQGLYWVCYLASLGELYEWDPSRGGVLRADARMPSFGALMGESRCCLLYLTVILLSLALIAVHMRYYYRGSKSIYVMRRLPRRLLWRQLLTLPVCGVVLCLLWMGALSLLDLRLYFAITPASVGAALL